jgi:hypothetical protein
MSRSLLHDWECAIDKCCREDNPTGMIDIAEDIYNTAYARGKNHSIEVNEVLDKIRAEIEEPLKINQGLNTDSAKAQTIALSWVLEVIDKYKAESEG